MFRVGNGYDVHRLEEGEKLILGGVEIPHPKGLLGHSDADALCHAICDALLGASGGGDLGLYFPDTDPRWRGVSSLVLLEKVGRMVNEKGFQIMNIDSTIVAQKPKLASYMNAMKDNLAKALSISPFQVNIKATTTEKLGFPGREEGLAAYAVALIEKI